MPHAGLVRYFAAPSRERGEALARARSVRLRGVTEVALVADAWGTDQYVIELDVAKKTVWMGCSCPHAHDGNFCKHLWAALLLLDTEPSPQAVALRSALAKVSVVRLTPVSAMSDEDAFIDDDVFDPDDEPEPVALAASALWRSMIDRAEWQMRAAEQLNDLDRNARTPRDTWPADRRIVYALDGTRNGISEQSLVLELMTERQGRDGQWSAPKRFAYTTAVWRQVPDTHDRDIMRLLIGAAPLPAYGNARSSYVIAPHALPYVLPMVCATGRARIRLPGTPSEFRAVQWDTTSTTGAETPDAWTWAVALERVGEGWQLGGYLTRHSQRRPLADAAWLHHSGLCLLDDLVAPLIIDGQWPLLRELWQQGPIPVGPDPSQPLERLLSLPRVPTLDLPPELAYTSAESPPVPGVRFVADPAPWRLSNYGGPKIGLELGFRYGSAEVLAQDPSRSRFDLASRTLFQRDKAAEQRAVSRLYQLGAAVTREPAATRVAFVLPRTQMRRLAQQLTGEGWWVEADGHAFRQPGAVSARVRSGVDWFDLEGSVTYGEHVVPLAEILDAQRRGEELLALPDGSLGMMPQEWLARLGPVFAGGERTTTGTRFRRSQLALLDALLATLPEVDMDAVCAQQREALRGFERVVPADAPASFTATLREYQREGLGWMHFLRTFGFGGCLADDMGLGKTIQVLALLDQRRADGHGPSLVVVPRSLVFNWKAEAARFAPALRVGDWSNGGRHDKAFDTKAIDVALVTYGTLRRDAARLADLRFDYVILDEAQAIKNRGTATAKACRVLQASHRLALSGTPVENRVDELWSLLDFLNPGLLGTSSRFTTALRAMTPEDGGTDVLGRALRPVLLRRTKREVAPELPARIERTLLVELEPKQRKFYDALRDRVRADVMAQVQSQGIGKSRLHILEGLLRLRQAACHPVLVDARMRAAPSAKLDALVPALVDVAAEGHKALVFSQFTSLLSLVRTALDAEGIVYEYLDGRTRDREARVTRFQQDTSCPVFLISLKAGGHGLTLTAADYVYLLDPWWNPAVEAQAIDRAHRIGRTRHVVATRLVASDTIEEKILALQESKRALADAILSADRGGLQSIGTAELELLLG